MVFWQFWHLYLKLIDMCSRHRLDKLREVFG